MISATTARRACLSVMTASICLVGCAEDKTGESGPAALASSYFTTDSEGWTIFQNGDSSTPIYSATGGNPGGMISAEDAVLGPTYYFRAPADFLGDVSGCLDTTLQYDLMVAPDGELTADPDVRLTGGGLTVVYDTGRNPSDSWSTFEVPMAPGDGWHMTDLGGETPSDEAFLDVLSDLSTFMIRGEYRNWDDTCSLDNVIFCVR